MDRKLTEDERSPHWLRCTTCEDACADCGLAIYYCERCSDYFHFDTHARCFLIRRGHEGQPVVDLCAVCGGVRPVGECENCDPTPWEVW